MKCIITAGLFGGGNFSTNVNICEKNISPPLGIALFNCIVMRAEVMCDFNEGMVQK